MVFPEFEAYGDAMIGAPLINDGWLQGVVIDEGGTAFKCRRILKALRTLYE
jgi:hypothetical protein